MYTLPNLPYSYSALEPFIDTKTMEIHHTKHHQAYVDKLNAALERHPELLKKGVEKLLREINSVPEDIRNAVRNNAGGHMNHGLFWNWMTSNPSDREAKGEIVDVIKSVFGSLDEFKVRFNEVALGRFGSGWAWLALYDNKIEIYSTANQDSPLMDGKSPLLGLDVWEHAYYLKHMSNRKAYVEGWWNVVNWKMVNKIYLSVK